MFITNVADCAAAPSWHHMPVKMIGDVVYAMGHGGTLGDLSATVHPYPTQAEALRKPATYTGVDR